MRPVQRSVAHRVERLARRILPHNGMRWALEKGRAAQTHWMVGCVGTTAIADRCTSKWQEKIASSEACVVIFLTFDIGLHD